MCCKGHPAWMLSWTSGKPAPGSAPPRLAPTCVPALRRDGGVYCCRRQPCCCAAGAADAAAAAAAAGQLACGWQQRRVSFVAAEPTYRGLPRSPSPVVQSLWQAGQPDAAGHLGRLRGAHPRQADRAGAPRGRRRARAGRCRVPPPGCLPGSSPGINTGTTEAQKPQKHRTIAFAASPATCRLPSLPARFVPALFSDAARLSSVPPAAASRLPAGLQP